MPTQPGAQLCIRAWRVVWGCALVATLALTAPPAAAQRRSPAEDLVEQERIRTEVQRSFNLYYGPARDGGVKTDNMNVALDRLAALGADAIPYLEAELVQALPHNFMFVALALGRIATPEAAAALRQAAEAADAEDNEFAPIRRAWACYSLAMLGDVEGVRLLTTGRHLAGQTPAHDEITVLEAAALYTAPAGLEVLHASFDRLFAEPEPTRGQVRELIATIAALKMIGDPSSVPRLLKALESPDARLRREAADTLQVIPSEASVAALMAVLRNDATPHVRYAAGWSIEQMLPESQLAAVLDLLKTEPDGNVRAVLYRVAVKLGGDAALDPLRPYLGGPVMEDREGLMRALRLMRTDKTYPVFRAALQDPSTRVLAQAVKGLIESSNPRSIDALIEAVESPRWIVAFLAVRALAEQRIHRASPTIARRLVEHELTTVVSDPQVREHVYELGNALVALNYHKVREALPAGIDRQRDGQLQVYLAELMTLLTTLANNGDDVALWTPGLTDELPALRQLAARRLAEIGTPEAAQALAATFRRVDMNSGRVIMRQLGAIDQPASRELIERVLTAEAFDDFIRWPLREEAAYGAVRLGGDDMIAALTRAWERRGGLEGRLMVYLAALAEADAIEPLERFRVSRMHYQKWTRGRELETLDRLVRELRAGRSVAFMARPPQEVDFRRPSWLPM